jgi:hypothetical protein
MVASFNRANDETKNQRDSFLPGSFWSLIIDLWMTAIVTAFFLIRVLGSRLGEQFLSRISHLHLP